MQTRALLKLFALLMDLFHTNKRSNRILNYHSIDTDIDLELNIEPASFNTQIEIIDALFEIVDLNSEPFRDQNVSITFDDAYKNFLTNVFPIIEKLKIPVTIFVPTAFIEHGKVPLSTITNKITKKLKPMNWRDLAMLNEHKFIKLGLHSHNHVRYDKLTNHEIIEDINASKVIFKNNMGYVPDIFAFPQGHLNQDSLNLVMEEFEMIYGLNLHEKLIKDAGPRAKFRQSILKSDTNYFFQKKLMNKLFYEDSIKALLQRFKF